MRTRRVQQPSKDALAGFVRERALVTGDVIGRNREEVSRFRLEVRHYIRRDLADDEWRAREVVVT